ncbi:hypothetical protein [Bradyrhizobium sp. USDA 3364]
MLIGGSKKVIGHHRLLLASRKTGNEREPYLNWIEREQRLLDELQAWFPENGSRRDLSDGPRSLCGVRHRAEAARPQVEMVRLRGWRRGRHVRLGMQPRRSEIQGAACAVSPAVRERRFGHGSIFRTALKGDFESSGLGDGDAN